MKQGAQQIKQGAQQIKQGAQQIKQPAGESEYRVVQEGSKEKKGSRSKRAGNETLLFDTVFMSCMCVSPSNHPSFVLQVSSIITASCGLALYE